MTLVHCMGHDYFWIAVTVALDVSVALGYVLIALHWRRNERRLRDSAAKSALGSMKLIFLFCGLCGYLFIPVKMFWPAWRLYDGFLAVLVFFTWKYALGTRGLGVVYSELGRTDRLAHELEASREGTRRQGQFLNAVSHDLKTPLNGLLLQIDVAELSVESNDPESIREALCRIRTCARTTAELVNHFVEIGRLDWSDESVHVTPFRLADALSCAIAEATAAASARGLTVTSRVAPELSVRTDAQKLSKIVRNLLDNALKYTDRGTVSVEAECRGSALLLHVVDTGIGIAAEDQSRIFDDFVQVGNRERDSRKGFGLGLAIALRLARQLGGHLTVESRPGQGSRFTLHLPDAIPERDGNRRAGGVHARVDRGSRSATGALG
jgi:signal transduction histidine kinase